MESKNPEILSPEVIILYNKLTLSINKFKKTRFRKESARLHSIDKIEKLKNKLKFLFDAIPEVKKGIVKVEYNVELEV